MFLSERVGPMPSCLFVNPGGGRASMAATFQRKAISPALRAFLAGQILFASRRFTALRPQAVQPARPPPVGSQQDAMGANPD